MSDYPNFPPYKYFLRILKTHSKSALLYIQLWQEKDRFSKVAVQKHLIRREFLISKTIFRNLLTALKYTGVLDFNEDDRTYKISLLGSDD